jgi:hypothetical protein
MEAHIARLESDVAHLCTDVADVKVDVRSVRDKLGVLGTKLAERHARDDGTGLRLGLSRCGPL